jgi:hypothetical protein
MAAPVRRRPLGRAESNHDAAAASDERRDRHGDLLVKHGRGGYRYLHALVGRPIRLVRVQTYGTRSGRLCRSVDSVGRRVLCLCVPRGSLPPRRRQ